MCCEKITPEGVRFAPLKAKTFGQYALYYPEGLYF